MRAEKFIIKKEDKSTRVRDWGVAYRGEARSSRSVAEVGILRLHSSWRLDARECRLLRCRGVVLWWRRGSHATTMPIHCGNQVIIFIIGNLAFRKRTKHIEIDCHFISDKVLMGVISTPHVSSLD